MQSQSREDETALPTSQDQLGTSDARNTPIGYHTQGASFSSASDFVTSQNAPYHRRPTERYCRTSEGSEADVGITVEHVIEPPGIYYNVQASHSLSSLVRPIFLLSPSHILEHLGAYFYFVASFISGISSCSSLDSMMCILLPPRPIRKHIPTHLHIPRFRGLRLQRIQILPRVIPVSHRVVTSPALLFV